MQMEGKHQSPTPSSDTESTASDQTTTDLQYMVCPHPTAAYRSKDHYYNYAFGRRFSKRTPTPTFAGWFRGLCLYGGETKLWGEHNHDRYKWLRDQPETLNRWRKRAEKIGCGNTESWQGKVVFDDVDHPRIISEKEAIRIVRQSVQPRFFYKEADGKLGGIRHYPGGWTPRAPATRTPQASDILPLAYRESLCDEALTDDEEEDPFEPIILSDSSSETDSDNDSDALINDDDIMSGKGKKTTQREKDALGRYAKKTPTAEQIAVQDAITEEVNRLTRKIEAACTNYREDKEYAPDTETMLQHMLDVNTLIVHTGASDDAM